MDEYSYPLHMAGTASTLGAEDQTAADKRVSDLRAVVEEITRRPLPEAPRRPFGFIPGAQ